MNSAAERVLTITPLGQSGFIFTCGEIKLVIDPYLTDAVADRYGAQYHRQIPAPLSPEQLTGLWGVFITHAHLDHCDPPALKIIGDHSPRAIFYAAPESIGLLRAAGLSAERIRLIEENWVTLAGDISYRAVPAAHTAIERDAQNHLRCAGFIFRFGRTIVYHAGDTMPHEEIVRTVTAAGPVDYAFLPVNERNYYRDQADIVGNMSVREAFQFAVELKAKTVIPIHWDIFAGNSVYPEEIELLHQKTKPPFALRLCPVGRDVVLT